MGEIAVIIGAVALFVAGFASWYAIWHHKVAASFERVRVPVRAGRQVHLLRQDADQDHRAE